jgi:hypothetical protein
MREETKIMDKPTRREKAETERNGKTAGRSASRNIRDAAQSVFPAQAKTWFFSSARTERKRQRCDSSAFVTR